MNKKITVAIIDKGGRGNVLLEKYAGSSQVSRLVAIPGNDFMKMCTEKPVVTYPNVSTSDISQIVAICQKEHVSLVDVCQDNAVAAGLVNALAEVGIKTVGPTREAGEIEWSKVWSREFLRRHHVPQPDFMSFDSVTAGEEYLQTHSDQSWFVKANGLAEGKGALPANSNKEAIFRIQELSRFGLAGEKYLLEEWIKGENGKIAEEFSAFAICNGESFSIIGYAQDYKRALDNDQGENTGGMGCVTPPPTIDHIISDQVQLIFDKTVTGLKNEGRPYNGILYLGGIVGSDKKVKVVEFNARWGDPEAQVIIPGILNDFIELSNQELKTDGACRVVIAGTAKGYPQNYQQVLGKEILGLEEAMKLSNISIYGAGIKKMNSKWVVDGGRIFYVVAVGDSLEQAQMRAYKAMSGIRIEGDNLHFRTDIGSRYLSK